MITLTAVHKAFGEQEVLRGLNLTIPPGAITAIIGPSGEGKSVLLKHMIGLLTPDSGTVTIDGLALAGMSRLELNRFRERFAMVFQNAALFDSMTVYENMAFPLEEKTRLSREEIDQRINAALAEVNLSGVLHKFPDELSGGMRKRVGFARALLLKPQVVLFDEPTTGLDPVIRNTIHQLIINTQRKFGYTAVMVSHDIPEIFDVADHIAMLYQGTILQFGTAAEIKDSTNPIVRQFVSGSLDGPITNGAVTL